MPRGGPASYFQKYYGYFYVLRKRIVNLLENGSNFPFSSEIKKNVVFKTLKYSETT